MADFQDWKPVVFGSNKNTKTNHQDTISVPKPKHNNTSFVKEDEETGMVKINIYGTEYGKKVQQARCEKKLKQKELAQKLNVKEEIVREIENGKGKVDGQICNKIFRVLGVKRN